MTDKTIERFFCNNCKNEIKHDVQSEYKKRMDDDQVWLLERNLIVECRGCENVQLVKKTLFSEDIEPIGYDATGDVEYRENWDENIYPPVTYRSAPDWFEDLPDATLRDVSSEIYKSLQSGSRYLATFGSRTLIDRLMVLVVGDEGTFRKGLKALKEEKKISEHEENILTPVIEAGNAAAHRRWVPTEEELTTILDTVEGLIHRLLVLPQLAEELKGSVPSRTYNKTSNTPTTVKKPSTIVEKIEAAPKHLKSLYKNLESRLKALGEDVKVSPQKHYMAFRRTRNFASVQMYNQKEILRVYLNLDPEAFELDANFMRDVRQIGHYGTGNLEFTITSEADLEKVSEFIIQSYNAS